MERVRGLFRTVFALCLLTNSGTYAAFELGLGDDLDLTTFVTRPDIKAPILNVTKYHPDRVSPGYFFTAPYVRIYQEAWATSYYQPCQSGPHIYDNDGNLVWSGACQFTNRNQADFRPAYFNKTWHLSAIDMGLEYNRRNEYGAGNTTGRGLVLDASYEVRSQVRMPKHIDSFNMHEFRLVDDGKSALAILYKPKYTDVSMLEGIHREAGWVDDMGFVEIDVATGKPKFQWMALDHLSVTESTTTPEYLQGPLPDSWDFLHLDSVDKSPDGDYLISSRHTDTIYCISHKDGAVQWRLGGKKSDFKLEGLNFSRQHDARFLHPKNLPFQTKKSLNYISIFDNAADEGDEDPAVPSVLIVALDQKHKIAHMVRRVHRPDGQSTLFSGNGYFLPNGNLFASWASNSYVTEHDANDNMVMEARFLSNRFNTYRSFKSDFRAVPSELPVLYCAAYGTARPRATTACWVSWNGATEVRHWRFRSMQVTPETILRDEEVRDGVLGTVSRTGFETRLQLKGFVSSVIAEALDVNGQILVKSKPVEVFVAQPWQAQDTHLEELC